MNIKKNLDPSNMHRMIADYPHQFGKGFELITKTIIKTPVERIVVTGMGGSALAGDLINCAFEDEMKSPLLISRNYNISHPLDENTLVVVISFSGNTEETISSYKQAIEAGAQVVAIASGGKLLEMVMRDGVEYIKLTKESTNFQPRMSSGYVFAILTGLVTKAGFLPLLAEKQVNEMSVRLSTFSTEIQGKQLGESLFGTIPLIYTSDKYWPIARIAKIKLNENSKIPAFWNVLPELNHNEMVGFSNTKDNYRILMLRDLQDNHKISERMDATGAILRERPIGLKATVWDMIGETKLEKIFLTLMVMDWASYYLAMKMGINPTPVKLVEDFKIVMK